MRAARRARRRVGFPFGGLKRRRWENHSRNQAVDPVEVLTAGTIDDLVTVVNQARQDQLTARCVGSGHSWSDVALTTGYLIAPDDLSDIALADRNLLRPGTDDSRLVRVGSGTTIRELNAWLDRHGLGLTQMGGYDGQTFTGAASTSTHGSGTAFGPLCDYIRSVDLVDGMGRRRRVEPAGGITDQTAFAQARLGWELCQKDEWFEAVICGMGSLGLIFSVVVEVRDKFELTERRRLSTWTQVRADLERGVPGDYDHYEVYVNPYARASKWTDGKLDRLCIVTTRQPPDGDRGSSHRPLLPELLARLRWPTALVMRLAGALAPGVIPALLDISLNAIKSDGYTNVSYRVFNIGSANDLRAYSAEMAVPTAGGEHVEAMDRVLEVADQYRRRGAIYHTAPIALRFVASSPALMSMMQGRETMTMELIQLVDTDGGMEILAAHEEALRHLDVRPHWGQINTLSADELAGRYPERATWARIREELDPHEVFAGPFTKRVGITSRGVRS
jgi:hypothetical protein